MPSSKRDYGGKSRTAPRKTPASPKRGSRSKSSPPRTLFHGPSFSAGTLLGAAVVLLGAYAPQWLETSTEAPPAPVTEARPQLKFEFHDMLAESTVAADASVYEPPPPEAGDFLIQAASFRDVDDADALRARLLLEDLPVETSKVALDTGTWYRVTVGPFANKDSANRVLSRLRALELQAILI